MKRFQFRSMHVVILMLFYGAIRREYGQRNNMCRINRLEGREQSAWISRELFADRKKRGDLLLVDNV